MRFDLINYTGRNMRLQGRPMALEIIDWVVEEQEKLKKPLVVYLSLHLVKSIDYDFAKTILNHNLRLGLPICFVFCGKSFEHRKLLSEHAKLLKRCFIYKTIESCGISLHGFYNRNEILIFEFVQFIGSTNFAEVSENTKIDIADCKFYLYRMAEKGLIIRQTNAHGAIYHYEKYEI